MNSTAWKIFSGILVVLVLGVGFFAYTTNENLTQSKSLVETTQATLDETEGSLSDARDELATSEDENASLASDNSSYNNCTTDLMNVDYTSVSGGIFIYTSDIKPVLICFDNVQNGVKSIAEPVNSL